MKKWKTIVLTSILCFFTICLLCGCESEETKMQNINDLITRLSSGEEVSDTDVQIYKNYADSELFEKAVCKELDTFNKDSDYDKVLNLLTALNNDSIDYQSEEMNKIVAETIEQLKTEYLSITDVKDIDVYLSKLDPFLKLYDYVKDVDDIYGTDEIIDFAQKNGTKIITKDNAGGYFDSRKGDYKESETKYFDPLSNRYVSYGEVGTYKTKTSYEFYGDILKERKSEIWYTPYSEPNGANTSYFNYEYKNLGSDILHGNANSLISGDVEGYDLSKDDSTYLIIYDKEDLQLIHGDDVQKLSRV